MPFSQTDFLSLLLHITWSCINVETYINPLFRAILPSFARLSELLSSAGLVPCPGLFGILQSIHRPSIAYFESLSDHAPFNSWGIYVQILRKAGRKALLYIGSGTGVRGVRIRLSNYVTGTKLPSCISDAIKDGYKIVHRALLVRCPIPSPSQIPSVRVAMFALEAAFSCIFSAMHNRNTSYGFPNILPWNKHLLDYDGVCSHSALVEDVPSNFDLSEQELEEMAELTREKNRVYQQQYGLEQRDNPTDEFKAKQKAKNQAYKPKLQAQQQLAVQSKLHSCGPCGVDCRNHSDLKVHLATSSHFETLNGFPSRCCVPCGRTGPTKFKYPSDCSKHKKTPKCIAKTALFAKKT